MFAVPCQCRSRLSMDPVRVTEHDTSTGQEGPDAGPVDVAGPDLPEGRESGHADARRHRGHLRATGARRRRVRLREPGRADPRPDRLRAAVPAAHPADPGPVRRSDLGGRRGLRHHLPRTPVRPATPRHACPAARAGRADHVAPARPGAAVVGDVPGRGVAGGPVRDHREVPPSACRRQQHGRHRPGRPGLHRASRATPPPTPGSPRTRRRRWSCSRASSPTRPGTRPPCWSWRGPRWPA